MATETTYPATGRVERFKYTAFDEKPASAKPGVPALQGSDVKPVAVPAIPEPQPPPPPPPPAITEKDLQAAKAEAHARGHAEGVAATESQQAKEAAAREEAIRNLLEVIGNRITIAAENHAHYMKSQEGVMGKLIIAIARKLTADTLKAEPFANVEALLRDCLGLIAGKPKVTIIVSPARSVELTRRIDSIKSRLQGFDGELVVEENASLGHEDCKVEWKDGYGEYNADALWKSIEDIIAKKTNTGTQTEN